MIYFYFILIDQISSLYLALTQKGLTSEVIL